MKACSKCKVLKPPPEFVRDARTKLGVTSSCKTCRAAASHARRAADPIAARQYEKQWRQRRGDQLRQYMRDWQRKTRPQRTASHKKWLANHPEYLKQRYRKHRESLLAKHREWLAANRETARELTRQWRARNKPHRAAYVRIRRRTNLQERIL